MRQPWLIAYDISDPALRRRALQMIAAQAVARQKSAFECWFGPAELQALRQRLRALVQSGDHLLISRLDSRATTHRLGVAPPPHDGSLFYQG